MHTAAGFHCSTTREQEVELKASSLSRATLTTKTRATAAASKRAVKNRGSVRIRNRNGRIQEERTYPRSADPRSKG
jgi:hypothetical protein